MKTLYKLLFTTAPLALAMLLSANAEAATTIATVPFAQQEVALSGGEDGKTEAKAEKAKTSTKPKKVKNRRVNHGPKKPIFPQTDRKKEKLNRARYLNAHR